MQSLRDFQPRKNLPWFRPSWAGGLWHWAWLPLACPLLPLVEKAVVWSQVSASTVQNYQWQHSTRPAQSVIEHHGASLRLNLKMCILQVACIRGLHLQPSKTLSVQWAYMYVKTFGSYQLAFQADAGFSAACS